MAQVCMHFKPLTALLPDRPNPGPGLSIRGSSDLSVLKARPWPRTPGRRLELVCSARQAGRNDLDPWRTLGVAEGSDEKAIKRAFRKLALRHHPDLDESPDAHIRFMAAQRAYEILIGRGRGKEDREGVWSEGGGWDFHDWYWKFSMNRRRSVARGPRAPVTGAAGAPLQTLQSQLAGLKRKAAFRQTRPATAPATTSDATDSTPEDATTPAGHPHSQADPSAPATAPNMSETAPEHAVTPGSHPHSPVCTFPSDTFLPTQEPGERTVLFEAADLAHQPAPRGPSHTGRRAPEEAPPLSAAQADTQRPVETVAAPDASHVPSPTDSHMPPPAPFGAHASRMPSHRVSGSVRRTKGERSVGEANAHARKPQAGARRGEFHAAAPRSVATSAGDAGLRQGLQERDFSPKDLRANSALAHMADARRNLAHDEELQQMQDTPLLLHRDGSGYPADTSHSAGVSTAHESGVSRSLAADPHRGMFMAGSTGRPYGHASHPEPFHWDVRGAAGESAAQTERRGAHADEARVWHPSPSPLVDLLACAREFFAEVALRRAGGRGVVEATFSSLGAHLSAVAARGPRVAALAGVGQADISQDIPDAFRQMAQSELEFAHGEASALSHSGHAGFSHAGPMHAEASHAVLQERVGTRRSAAVLSDHDARARHAGPMGKLAQHDYAQAPEISLEFGPGVGSAGRGGAAANGEGGAQGEGGEGEGKGDAPGRGPTGPRGTHADQLQGQLAGLKRRAALRRPRP